MPAFLIAIVKTHSTVINVIMIYRWENVMKHLEKIERKATVTFSSNPNAVNSDLLWVKKKLESIYLAWYYKDTMIRRKMTMVQI